MKRLLVFVLLFSVFSCRKSTEDDLPSYTSQKQMMGVLTYLFMLDAEYKPNEGLFYFYGPDRSVWRVDLLDVDTEVRTSNEYVSIYFECRGGTNCISYMKESGYLLIPNDRARINNFVYRTKNLTDDANDYRVFFEKARNYLKH